MRAASTIVLAVLLVCGAGAYAAEARSAKLLSPVLKWVGIGKEARPALAIPRAAKKSIAPHPNVGTSLYENRKYEPFIDVRREERNRKLRTYAVPAAKSAGTAAGGAVTSEMIKSWKQRRDDRAKIVSPR